MTRLVKWIVKLGIKVALVAFAIGVGWGFVTGTLDLSDTPLADGQASTERAGLPGGGLAASAPSNLCPAGCPNYPGDHAAREQRAAWMGNAAQQRGLPPELPVMASLVESSMRNLNYGDADSVGLFQMRLSIWNSGAYAGYPTRPHLQLDWFLDKAQAVKADRAATGRPLTPAHYGEWVADIERPAARYRYRYQLRLDEARALLQTTSK